MNKKPRCERETDGCGGKACGKPATVALRYNVYLRPSDVSVHVLMLCEKCSNLYKPLCMNDEVELAPVEDFYDRWVVQGVHSS